LFTVCLASFLAMTGCTETPPPVAPAPAAAGAPQTPGDAVFTDRAVELGIDFAHFNGMSGEYYLCEIMGNGGALFDYDNDGDLDVYITQGQMPGPKTPEQATPPPSGSMLPLQDRLFRNLLVEQGELRFRDETDQAGLELTGYGMGVATGDYDRDGFIDLYVTNFGQNVMLRNDGDGTFSEVTVATGTAEERWSTAAAFLDFDGDGWLDLYVGNYVDFTIANHTHCYAETTEESYCLPAATYQPLPDRLFRNRGDGTFEDVTARSGLAQRFGPALGVAAADFDGDGRLDIYVANDGQANNLWVNRGDDTFEDRALMVGVAYNEHGKAEASMGVDVADFDADGDPDLFITHLADETNTLYVNDGNGIFDDATAEFGLGFPSLPNTGFGTAWFDYDNDGWLDLLIGNGAVTNVATLVQAGDPYPYHQTNQLFRNVEGRFVETTRGAGEVFELSEVSRGAAFGDVDNDGDTDVLLMNNNGPARLLINLVGNRKHWLGLRVTDTGETYDVVGARIEALRPDGTSLWRHVRTAASYLSANDPRVLFGLAGDLEVPELRVHWPDGTIESWGGLAVDRYHVLRRGTGRTGA
jgi:hypothetical protein